tara:strand:+ start:18 stop:1880 length:1863 start_codon:yes stop_codon:yes gene_type:complete
MVSGKKLTLSRKGYGEDLTVNGIAGAGGRASGIIGQDADLGPRPLRLDFVPVGNNLAAKIIWEVEFHLRECDSYGYGAFDEPVAITYGVSWSIGEDGLTQRNCTGEIEIPVARVGLTSADALAKTVDEYRHYVKHVVSMPPGFTRRQEYKMNENKKILQFRIVDTEIESDNPYFPGILSISAQHRTKSSLNGGPFGGSAFNVWTSQLDVDIKVKKGMSKCRAYEVFLLLCALKTELVPGTSVVTTENHTTASDTNETTLRWLPWEIDIQDDIFSRSMRMTFAWILFAGLEGWADQSSGPGTFSARTTCEAAPLKGQDMFQPIAGKPFAGGAGLIGNWPNNWWRWSQSMYSTAPETMGPFTQRSYAHDVTASRAQFNDKLIWNPCSSGEGFFHWRADDTGKFMGKVPDTGKSFQYAKPKVEDSLMSYKASVSVDSDYQTMSHRRRSGAYPGGTENPHYVIDQIATDGITGQQGSDANVSSGYGNRVYNPVKKHNEDNDETAPRMQVTGPATHRVIVQGTTVSCFWSLDPPKTQKWGDATLYLQRQSTRVHEFTTGIIPLYQCDFVAVYSCSQAPANHPFQQEPGGDEARNAEMSKTSKTTAIPSFNTRTNKGSVSSSGGSY